MKEYHFFITEQDIEKYAAVSGDHNPIHVEEEYAKALGFSGKMAHGLLTMAKVWSVLSLEAFTPYDFLKEYELSFLSPVYVGDEVVLQIESSGNGFKVIGRCGSGTVLRGAIRV